MSSLAQLIADEKRMTDIERRNLIEHRRFNPSVVEFLSTHGFREAGDRVNGDRTTTATFLRQTHYPHIHIPVEPTDDIDAILTAIYDAGHTDGSDRIATLHQKFIEAVQRPRRPSATERSIDQRLAALESQLKCPAPPTEH